MEKTETFVIDSEERADWLLRKLANLDAEADRVKANSAKRLQELTADRESLLYRFGDQLTAWCRSEAERRRRKTITLTQGTVSFRAVPARFVVTDERQAIKAARAACPTAVAVATIERLDRNALLDYVGSTGDVLPGVELIAASESVSIKPGAKEESK